MAMEVVVKETRQGKRTKWCAIRLYHYRKLNPFLQYGDYACNIRVTMDLQKQCWDVGGGEDEGKRVDGADQGGGGAVVSEHRSVTNAVFVDAVSCMSWRELDLHSGSTMVASRSPARDLQTPLSYRVSVKPRMELASHEGCRRERSIAWECTKCSLANTEKVQHIHQDSARRLLLPRTKLYPSPLTQNIWSGAAPVFGRKHRRQSLKNQCLLVPFSTADSP
ncbi:hypothetical protein EDD85DRAFT_783014 [Armillaria nabsnona]|nr:hypothetical protein EDD85DRAFT_783014 [Armillaria nabsnona]